MSRPYQAVPENLSFAQPNKFIFTIPKMPHLIYFCQSVNIPGINTSAPIVENPFSATYRHGDKLSFEPLTLSFLVDEDFRSWEETYKWLQSMTFPESYDQYRNKKFDKQDIYYDGILTLNTNANQSNFKIKFLHCHPVSLSAIPLDIRKGPDDVVTSTVTFRYDRFEVDRS